MRAASIIFVRVCLLAVYLVQHAAASAPGEWPFLSECQACGEGLTSMTSPACSDLRDVCKSNPAYATANEHKFGFFGDGRVDPICPSGKFEDEIRLLFSQRPFKK